MNDPGSPASLEARYSSSTAPVGIVPLNANLAKVVPGQHQTGH